MPGLHHILCIFLFLLTACQNLVEQQQILNRQMMQAAQSADDELLENLLNRGANPNAVRNRNETALGLLMRHYKRSHLDKRERIESAVAILLSKGADANALHHGFTPLQIATGQRSEGLVNMLLQHGANPSSATRAGLAPIWQTVYDNNYKIGRRLLEAGANPNALNSSGQTPLQYLRSKGYIKTRLMLDLRKYGGH